MPPPVPQPTRRQLLLAGSALLGSGLLAACGQDELFAGSHAGPLSSPALVRFSTEAQLLCTSLVVRSGNAFLLRSGLLGVLLSAGALGCLLLRLTARARPFPLR